MKAAVLGGGLVGRAIAWDLSRDFDVVVVDVSEEALSRACSRPNVKGVKASALDKEALGRVFEEEGVEIVCGAVPGHLGYQVMRNVIELGKDMVDISFMPEDSSELDGLARSRKVTVVADMGLAPGLSNALVGKAQHLLKNLHTVKIYVGGLPAQKCPPFDYKIVFSPEDVIEEYTRPARYVEDGQIREAEPLSQLEEIEFPGIGRFEAFLTDGLRSLLRTVRAKRMFEKTIRYHGHASQINLLKLIGLLSDEPVEVEGKVVSPRKLTSKLLFKLWEMDPDKGDRDMTLMRVEATGETQEGRITISWDLFDRYDEENKVHSMARTTAYPCAAVARAVRKNMVQEKGVIPPEHIGANQRVFKHLMDSLVQRGIRITETKSILKRY